MNSVFKEQDFVKGFSFSLWRKLFSFFRPYRTYIILLGLIMISVGILDAVFPVFTRYAIDKIIIPGRSEKIYSLIVAYGGLTVLQGLCVWILIVIAGKIEMGFCYDLRKKAFEHLQELSFSYYDRTPAGWIMARMTSDSRKLGEIISWGLVDLTWGISMMLGMGVFMIVINYKLALIALSVIVPLGFISIYFQKKILTGHRKIRKTNSQISGAYNEGIMGAKTTKVLVRESENLNEFAMLTGTMKRASIKTAVLSSLYLPIVLTIGSLGTGLALWAGGEGVINKTLSYGTLVMFISYTIQFFDPIREIARVISEIQAAQASAERFSSLIETPIDITDSKEVKDKYGDIFSPKRENWPKAGGRIEFRDVGFKYETGERVLSGFNLTIEEGETIALVGETGSGKSTIVNIVCRFYEPTEGKVLIDGKDYRELSLLWHHSNLGYVLQTPHLFSGTIYENINYGNLDASEQKIIEAAKAVNAHEFIMKKEKKYQSEVGEGGNLLSVGEKQLISFARAILSDPLFFILDEATSSIDTETEGIIQRAINRLLSNRTSIIIAHRLSTIKSADRILVIQKGKISEEGSHHELLNLRGHYYKLYSNQFMEEKEAILLSK